ncbi:hypothetical protein E2P81_ATG02380 [Venturia nashicola]|uniref:Uncharacterized protein n=1 Tax=Venturia nashicola TaxID=86259 RepID=A0A4Z1PFH3_9PEZI|nr:hypothetical protein E6O75_ATG02441 [Venturia nashicola]TLD36598.1 hypothetical protein E2P81_ATG02380 [Venturia nashicola]
MLQRRRSRAIAITECANSRRDIFAPFPSSKALEFGSQDSARERDFGATLIPDATAAGKPSAAEPGNGKAQRGGLGELVGFGVG